MLHLQSALGVRTPGTQQHNLPQLLLATLFLLWLAAPAHLHAQAPAPRPQTQTPARPPVAAPAAARTGAIHGSITDSTGAIIPQATVKLTPGSGTARTITAGASGDFAFNNLAPGRYTLSVIMAGFTPYQAVITVGTAVVETTAQLKLASVQQTVTVTENAVSIDPADNASSATISEDTMDSLSDDPDEMLTQLQALSGGGASATLHVDGFTATTLPPKSSILQIRVNSDPYSAENDYSPQYGGITIITKPGTDAIHGGIYATGNQSAFNARNPFIPNQPSYYSDWLNSFFTGPIGKNASYDFNINQNSNHGNAAIDAATLDANNNQTELIEAVPNPSVYYYYSGRVKFQPLKNDILSLGYAGNHNHQTNAGIGTTSLPTLADTNSYFYNSIRISNTLLFGSKIANVTRIQFDDSPADTTPVSTAPTLSVQGAFTGGGNSGGTATSNRKHYELQNYTSITAGRHNMELGTRVRSDFYTQSSTSNFNGSFTFPTLAAYQLTVQGLAASQSPAAIRAAGGGASLFSIAAGNPSTSASMTDGAIFAQDDFKLRPSFTISAGLRFESQTGIHDHGDWAPRAGFSWGIDKKKNWIIRGGIGYFYQRVAVDTILSVRRLNGTNVVSYTAQNPDFYPNIPSLSSLSATSSSVTYQFSPNLRTSYQLSYEGELDRSLGKHGSLAFTLRQARGLHVIIPRNINAPLPGTYNAAVPTSGTRPFGCCRSIDEYDAIGANRRTQFVTNSNIQFGTRASLYGNYNLSWQNADAAGGFPSNQYDIQADYGRAGGDVRQSGYLGYNYNIAKRIHVSGSIYAQSGSPFNITTGQDLNGDLQYNDRPALATDLTRASVIKTAYGNFDTAPIAGQTIIPINYGQGPAQLNMYVAAGRSFAWDEIAQPVAKPGQPAPTPVPVPPGHHTYNLDCNIILENPLNHPNYGNPVGTLGSPLFGQSISLGGGGDRSIRFNTSFRF